jgi:NifB/MoaA-like Fe-S oxidoreductase
VKTYQETAQKEHDLHFIHAGDEFYFLAQEEMPHSDTYDGYLQYENGVGMTRLLIDEFHDSYPLYKKKKIKAKHTKATYVTGRLIERTLADFTHILKEKGMGIDNQVIGITNDFFGDKITVSGLITGRDIVKQLEGIDLGDVVYIPENMLKSDEAIFLDNMTLNELENKLNTTVVPLPLKGDCLLEAMLGKEINYE